MAFFLIFIRLSIVPNSLIHIRYKFINLSSPYLGLHNTHLSLVLISKYIKLVPHTQTSMLVYVLFLTDLFVAKDM